MSGDEAAGVAQATCGADDDKSRYPRASFDYRDQETGVTPSVRGIRLTTARLSPTPIYFLEWDTFRTAA